MGTKLGRLILKLTYQRHQNLDFVLERLIICDFTFLHCLNSNFDTYIHQNKSVSHVNARKIMTNLFISDNQRIQVNVTIKTDQYSNQERINIPVVLFFAKYTAPYPPLPSFFSKKYSSLIFPSLDQTNHDLSCLIYVDSTMFLIVDY